MDIAKLRTVASDALLAFMSIHDSFIHLMSSFKLKLSAWSYFIQKRSDIITGCKNMMERTRAGSVIEFKNVRILVF